MISQVLTLHGGFQVKLHLVFWRLLSTWSPSDHVLSSLHLHWIQIVKLCLVRINLNIILILSFNITHITFTKEELPQSVID